MGIIEHRSLRRTLVLSVINSAGKPWYSSSSFAFFTRWATYFSSVVIILAGTPISDALSVVQLYNTQADAPILILFITQYNRPKHYSIGAHVTMSADYYFTGVTTCSSAYNITTR
ncbi:hypothetical protein BH10BAC2_BH10BAC2_00190 [soil metagenome]